MFSRPWAAVSLGDGATANRKECFRSPCLFEASPLHKLKNAVRFADEVVEDIADLS